MNPQPLLRLATPHLLFTLRPDLRWDLQPAAANSPAVQGAYLAIDWRQAGRRHSRQPEAGEWRVEQGERALQAHGLCAWASLRTALPGSRLSLDLEWALPQAHGLLLWRATIHNDADDPVELERVALLRTGPECGGRRQQGVTGQSRAMQPGSGRLVFDQDGLEDLAWLSDGWQSWSFAGVIGREPVLTRTRLGPLTSPMYLNPATSRPGGRLGQTSDMFGVLADRHSRLGILAGQLSERVAFAGLQAILDPGAACLSLNAHLDGAQLMPGASCTTDWAALAFIDLDHTDPLATYLEAVARENQARVGARIPAGWCSWYYFFEYVGQTDIERNAGWIAEHGDEYPLELVQIDDGFQPEVGDWLATNERFPDGHRALVDQIESLGQVAGLWLAPFIAKPGAAIVREHPDWLLRRPGGRPVRAGYNWNTFNLALDVTHPEVLNHIERVIRTAVKDWGYRYLKLDFLYAAALPGERHDPASTRASALRRALERIRQAAGEDVFLAACGCPLGPAVGLTDSMRIGPDVAPRWRPAYQGIELFFSREPSLPSVRNAVHNTLTRAALHDRWWINDPDCLILRESDSHLKFTEVELLATIVGLSGGTLMVSDEMATLTDPRLAILARLLPPLAGRPLILDSFDRLRPSRVVKHLQGALGQWALAAVINWEDRPAEHLLHVGQAGFGENTLVEAFDLWRCQALDCRQGQMVLTVPAHGVRLLRMQQRREPVGWIGDNLHLSSGTFVKRWQPEAKQATAQLDLGRRGQGSLWLRTPGGRLSAAWLDGQACDWEALLEGVVRVDLPSFRKAELKLAWDG